MNANIKKDNLSELDYKIYSMWIDKPKRIELEKKMEIKILIEQE